MIDFYKKALGQEDIAQLPHTKYTRNDSISLESGETGTAKSSVEDIDMDRYEWKWEYTIAEATKSVEKQRTVTKHRQVQKEKTVTEYREVEKERPVIKFRQVEKERTVTKERLETHYRKVPVFEYLLSR